MEADIEKVNLDVALTGRVMISWSVGRKEGRVISGR